MNPLVANEQLHLAPVQRILPNAANLSDDGWVGIVDDDASIRLALARVFHATDIPFATFSSAEEFLERGVADAPSCMVVDVVLRGMAGSDPPDRLLTSLAPIWPRMRITVTDQVPGAHIHSGYADC